MFYFMQDDYQTSSLLSQYTVTCVKECNDRDSGDCMDCSRLVLKGLWRWTGRELPRSFPPTDRAALARPLDLKRPFLTSVVLTYPTFKRPLPDYRPRVSATVGGATATKTDK